MTKKILLLFSLAFLLIAPNLYSQIKIKELVKYDIASIDSVFFNISASREILQLSDNWDIYISDSPENKTKVGIPASFSNNDDIIFQKKLIIPLALAKNKSIRLNCLGINYSSEISFNNVIIQKRNAGMFPFSVDIPNDIINFGDENILTIKVNHELDSKATIPMLQRFLFPENEGGIIRDVYLELLPKERVNSFTVEYSLSRSLRSSEVEFNVELTNEKFENDSENESDYYMSIYLLSPEKENLVQKTRMKVKLERNSIAKKNETVTIREPKLWSPESPEYYIAKVELYNGDNLVDETYKTLSFYSLEQSAEGVKLNGNNFAANGVTYYPSYKENGMLASYDQLKSDLKLIRDLGLNMVRFAKATPHPYALALCEKLGLFALVEMPINSLPEEFVADQNFRNRTGRYLAEMISGLKEYSAIAGIGVGGGFIPNSVTHEAFISDLGKRIKQNTNRFTYASFIKLPTRKINNLDFYGLELVSTPIEQVTSDLRNGIKDLGIGNIFISEATYPSYVGGTNGYLNKYSMEAQAKYFEDIIDLSKEKKIGGFVINSMFDIRGEFVSLYANYNKEKIYNIGILGEDRKLNRITYNTVYSKLNDGKRVSIPIGSERDDAPIFFILFGLGLGILLGVLVNSKKKFREDATRALLRPYNFYADIRDHRILSGAPTIVLMLILAGAHSLLVANLLYFLKTNILLEKILLSFGIPSLVSAVSYLAWNPIQATIVFFVATVLLFIFISLVIKGSSFFVRNRVYFSNIYFVVIWAFLPLAILLPIKLVLYKILVADVINVYIYIFLALYFTWILQRLIKGVYVIFDVSRGTVYFFGIMLVIFLFGGVLLYFQLAHSTLYYIMLAVKQHLLLI